MLNNLDYVLIVAAVVAALVAAVTAAVLRKYAAGSVLTAKQRPETVANIIYGSSEMRETFKPSSPLPMRMGETLACVEFGPEADPGIKAGSHEDDLYRWLERQSSDAKRISPAVRVRASESLAAQVA